MLIHNLKQDITKNRNRNPLRQISSDMTQRSNILVLFLQSENMELLAGNRGMIRGVGV